MQLRHRAALNGVELDEIDSRVIIQGVECGAPKSTQSAISLFRANGQRFSVNQRDNLDVKVKFGLLIRKTDMAARAALLDQVNNWAAMAQKEYGGAWLTVNYKENRRLHVMLAEPAEEGDLKEWTNVFGITFRAYGIPYWIEQEAEVYTSDVTSARVGTIRVNGSAQTVADIELANMSGAKIDTATVYAGAWGIGFTGLGLMAGETLVIDHSDEGRLQLRIRDGNGVYRSVYGKRSPYSANDLYVMPGFQTVRFQAQRACIMTAKAYGRFL